MNAWRLALHQELDAAHATTALHSRPAVHGGIQSPLQLSERSRVNKSSTSAIWHGMALRTDRDSRGKICHAPGCTPGDRLEFVGRPADEGSA